MLQNAVACTRTDRCYMPVLCSTLTSWRVVLWAGALILNATFVSECR